MEELQRPLGQLREIPTDKIKQNPENPRIYFRPEELDSLMSSIAQFGVQVPITVYQEGNSFTLIDGERRWRCASKLNIKRIPALIQPKPSALENLLLMFNIHALREQWDYLTIATKLPKVIENFRVERGKEPNEIELSEATGLTRGQIRRCRLLLDVPEQYIDELLDELTLPKQKQQLSEDFLIEMERALKAVERRFPDVVEDKDDARRTLISKYRSGIITNVTDLRKLSKIATSIDRHGIARSEARSSIRIILNRSNRVGISQVFSERFEARFDERKVELSIKSIRSYLESFDDLDGSEVSPSVRTALIELRELIDRVLEV